MSWLTNNYMQDIDENNDKKFERNIRYRIECYENLLSVEKNQNKRLEYLRSIVELYDSLRINALNYTKMDEREKRKCIRFINDIVCHRYEKIRTEEKYRKLKEKSMNDNDYSWDEYEYEEKQRDMRDEGEDR